MTTARTRIPGGAGRCKNVALTCVGVEPSTPQPYKFGLADAWIVVRPSNDMRLVDCRASTTWESHDTEYAQKDARVHLGSNTVK